MTSFLSHLFITKFRHSNRKYAAENYCDTNNKKKHLQSRVYGIKKGEIKGDPFQHLFLWHTLQKMFGKMLFVPSVPVRSFNTLLLRHTYKKQNKF